MEIPNEPIPARNPKKRNVLALARTSPFYGRVSGRRRATNSRFPLDTPSWILRARSRGKMLKRIACFLGVLSTAAAQLPPAECGPNGSASKQICAWIRSDFEGLTRSLSMNGVDRLPPLMSRAWRLGEFATVEFAARQAVESSRAIAQADPYARARLYWGLQFLGLTALHKGDTALAAQYLAKSTEALRAGPANRIVAPMMLLVDPLLKHGFRAEAQAHLAAWRESGRFEALISRWQNDIEHGIAPDFGPNLAIWP